MAAAFAERLRHFFLRMPKLIHQLFVALRLFQSIQIRTLDVFNDGNFHHFQI